MDEWKKRGHEVGGLTEGFRGYDGIFTIVEGIKAAGKAEAAAIKDAFWKVKVKGVHGDIVFIKQGPAGQRADRTCRPSTSSRSRAARSSVPSSRSGSGVRMI